MFFTFLSSNHGEIERNPGRRKTKSENFSCDHWNVNSLLAHDSEKLSVIEAYNSVYKYDFVCTFETFLNSSILGDSEDVQLKGYKLIKPNHPFDLRRGGVCIHYRESLAVEVINTLFLTECILSQPECI